jgi:hemerythrin-like domain-containing protein
MEEYLNKGIKEVISEFPKMADILNEYNIGCVPCNIGTCLLKDIVEIHGLPEEQEQELMRRIAKVIYPDRDVRIPKVERTTAPVEPEEITYSPPLRKLVDEHTVIKRWIALIPEVVEALDVESESGRRLILDGVDFIRSYADRFHHAKEEDILFKYSDESSEIIQTMYEDHEKARSHVKAIIEALERKDREAVIEHLNGYRELLTEHIKKEDEILYPWIDRDLSMAQVGELFSKFDEADSLLGKEVPEKYERFVNRASAEITRIKSL